MKNLPFLVVIGILLAGCGQQQEETQVQGSVGAAEETDIHTIPDELMTDGLRYLGAPFDTPIRYRLTRDEGNGLDGTRTFTIESGAKVISTWGGDLEIAPREVYQAAPEGVMAIEMWGPVDPPQLYLPATIEPGQTWSMNFKMNHPTFGGEAEFRGTWTAVGKEKVTVPLGEFEALVVEESSTITGGVQANMSGKTWFVKGIGTVKAEQNMTMNGQPARVTIVAIEEVKQ